jgi:hypothetical protein
MQRLDERDGLNNMSLLKDRMDNRQPSRLGETLRVPDGAVHRLNGSGWAASCNSYFEFEL